MDPIEANDIEGACPDSHSTQPQYTNDANENCGRPTRPMRSAGRALMLRGSGAPAYKPNECLGDIMTPVLKTKGG